MKRFYTEMPIQNSIQRMNTDSQEPRFSMPGNSEIIYKSVPDPSKVYVLTVKRIYYESGIRPTTSGKIVKTNEKK